MYSVNLMDDYLRIPAERGVVCHRLLNVQISLIWDVGN